MAVVLPPVTAVFMAVGVPLGAYARSGTPLDESLSLGLLVGVATLVLAGLWLFVEYGQVAIWGGGFDAGPEGLTIRYGRERWDVPWANVAGARVATDSMGDRHWMVLEIRFRDRGHEWPHQWVFWGSDDRRLRISPTLLPGTAPLIASGITAALAEWRGGATGGESPGPRPGRAASDGVVRGT